MNGASHGSIKRTIMINVGSEQWGPLYLVTLQGHTGREMELEAATSCEGSESHEFTYELSYRMHGSLDRGEIGMILVDDKSKMEHSRSARWMGDGVA